MAFAEHTDRKELLETGRGLRRLVGRCELATHHRRPGQVAVDLVQAGNFDRVPDLVPLRLARMAMGPFAFMRGAAAVMAHDLAAAPGAHGLDVQICGDAHLSNFGLFASPEGRQVMDLNDFDETLVGPFDYDLKRLCASIVVVARESSMSEDAAANAVVDGVHAYRGMTKALSRMPVHQQWAVGFNPRLLKKVRVSDLEKVLARVAQKARSNDSVRASEKMTVPDPDDWRFKDAPPILRRLDGVERDQVSASLTGYWESVAASKQVLLSRYEVADLAFRVVGVGSVGTRAYIALLHGSNDDPFVLQIKEARPSVYATDPRCQVPGAGHDGHRVVHGQQIMQTYSDPMLGWTQIAGRPFMVRTFRNLKGSIDPSLLGPHQLDDYARICAALMARAHARSLDPHLLRGYLGKANKLAEAMVSYARAYADQTEADYEAFLAAIKRGAITIADDPLR
ncbi:MAG: DUF2252 domain-containing protein [Actinomycetales bacterium]